MQKPGTPSNLPTKTIIFNWIKNICLDSSPRFKVEDLGDGVAYCKIINHYFSGIISLNRIILHPKTQYQNTQNLKLFQNALAQLKINIPLDVSKVSKQKFLQNWGLINSLYKHLVLNNQDFAVTGNSHQDSKNQALSSQKGTPKRTFQFAFSDQSFRQEALLNFTFNKNKTNSYQPKPYATINSIHQINNQIRQNYAQGSNYGNSSISQNYNYQNYNQKMELIRPHYQSYQNNLNQLNSCSQPYPPISNQINSRYPLSNRDSLIENNVQMQKCWSVGKIFKENSSLNESKYINHNQGKYSVNSHIFQSNYSAVIDRVKQILLKASHDIQKIRQIKMLLNIPLNQEIVKVEEQQLPQQNIKNNSTLLIPTKQSIEGATNTGKTQLQKEQHQKQQSQKQQLKSKSISNEDSPHCNNQSQPNQSVKQIKAAQNQTSSKKIKNNWSQSNFLTFKR